MKADKRKTEYWKGMINGLLDERLKSVQSFKDDQSFIGYNPVENIRRALFEWVAVPFGGVEIFCQLRCPNATQIEQCGDITNIVQDVKEGVKVDYEEILKIRNFQEALCKLVFNVPKFDDIFKLADESDFVVPQMKTELEDIKKRFEEHKDELTAVEKETLEKKIKTLELQTSFILPDDTMAFVTNWAMGNDVSDVKRITKDAFLRAAALAKAHHKAPSDYISGRFTDFNKKEIDTHAMLILEEYLKDQETVRKSKSNWFFGGRKREGGFFKRGGK